VSVRPFDWRQQIKPSGGLLLPGTRPAPVTMVTALQASHGYATNAGGSANLNDTSTWALGSQSVALTTDGAGTAKTIKRTGMAAIDATGMTPVVWINVDDHARLAGLQLYLGDTNLSRYWKFEYKASAAQKIILAGTWHKVTMAWAEATVTSTPARSAITDVQVRVVDDGTGPVTVHIGGIGLVPEPTAWPNGVVSLTFDDAYASHDTEARTYMDRYGFPGSACVIQDYVGKPGRLTLNQLHAMERYSGWEVVGHATSGAVHAARFTSLGQAGMARESAAIRDWLSDNGFTGTWLAYPGGEYDETVLSVVEQHFTAGRTTFQQAETLPPARRSQIRCNGYVTSTRTTSSLTTAVDTAYADRQWLVLAFHDVVAAASASTDYTVANFHTVIDYIASKGIPVRTVGDVLATRP